MAESKKTRLVFSTDSDLQKQIEQEKSADKLSQSFDLPPVQQNIRLELQTKGRRGKKVTLITGFQHRPELLKKLATELKQFCGSGGTVKDTAIEIQGDHRQKLSQKLAAMGYQIKKI
ncbi:MAG TPA: stress response translation initiation inhibitor YciH [bacterium]|nr:stress response translation initiation inhibitor YciH [bacterium]